MERPRTRELLVDAAHTLAPPKGDPRAAAAAHARYRFQRLTAERVGADAGPRARAGS
ncbi:hypothetical protein [Streptomyces sp. Qhu_M48]|uniref:hypothetical protein n=1 Tax=Streptomyces sp. Qhu_M48 TaxID=3435889 RepID=UPI003F4FD81B